MTDQPASTSPDSGGDLDIDAARASEAVFVWAPAARCGITLLQRLISSSREILAFGEMDLLGRRLPAAILEVSAVAEESRQAREQLVAGNYNFWASPALPHSEMLVDACIRSFYTMVAAYDRSVRSDGLQRWATKLPSVVPSNTHQIVAKLLPRSRHVWMTRDLESVLRSYKSRQWLKTVVDVAKVSATWVQSMDQIQQLPDDGRTFVLRHEELVAQPAEQIERLRAFLGVKQLDATVLDHRVNTFKGEAARGHSPSEYIQPSELSPDERTTMERIAGPHLARFGYGAS